MTETERTLARARMLLERYGLVSREVVAFEELPGGFGPVLKVLNAMEAAGRVRRGYFVEGSVWGSIWPSRGRRTPAGGG